MLRVQIRLCAAGAHERHLHVGLTASQPDLAYVNVLQKDRFFAAAGGQYIGPAYWKSGERRAKTAILGDRAGVFSSYADLNDVAICSLAPDRDWHALLENHMAFKHFRELHSLLLYRAQCNAADEVALKEWVDRQNGESDDHCAGSFDCGCGTRMHALRGLRFEG